MYKIERLKVRNSGKLNCVQNKELSLLQFDLGRKSTSKLDALGGNTNRTFFTNLTPMERHMR
jgi:hypothetical protein